jgi:Uma2 family endonuclease
MTAVPEAVLVGPGTESGAALRIPPQAIGFSGFNRWVTSARLPDGWRVARIRGELFIEMSPEEIQSHGQLKTEVIRTLANLVRARRLGRVYADRTLVTNEDADLSTEPDCTFVSHEAMRSGRVRWIPTESDQSRYLSLAGSPDLVVELVSRSSEAKDTQVLKDAYEEAGVKEYWLIDARRDVMSIQVFGLIGKSFQPLPVSEGKWRSSVLGSSFHLFRTRDEFGYWEYTLESE